MYDTSFEFISARVLNHPCLKGFQRQRIGLPTVEILLDRFMGQSKLNK